MKPTGLMNLDMDLPMGVFNHDSNLLSMNEEEADKMELMMLETLELMNLSEELNELKETADNGKSRVY